MSRRIERRRGYDLTAHGRYFGCLLMMFGLSLMVSRSLRAESPGESVEESATTSNQAISLDDPPTAASSAPDDVPTSSREPSVVSDPAVNRPEAPSEAASGGSLGARTVRRPRAGVESAAVSAPAAPWYRTGVVSLAIVLTVIGGLYFAVRRWAPSIATVEHDVLKVVARAAVGPKQQAVVLRFDGRLVLVGVSPERMDVLAAGGRGELSGAGAAERASDSGFTALLSSERVRYEPDGNEPGAAQVPALGYAGSGRSNGNGDALADLLDRLRSMKAG